MPKSNSMKNGMMLLFFNNTDFANIGDAAGLQNSAVAGNLYVSLHTGDPGAASVVNGTLQDSSSIVVNISGQISGSSEATGTLVNAAVTPAFTGVSTEKKKTYDDEDPIAERSAFLIKQQEQDIIDVIKTFVQCQ